MPAVLERTGRVAESDEGAGGGDAVKLVVMRHVPEILSVMT